MMSFPEIYKQFVDNILNNPYDIERNFFTLKFLENIPYFKNVNLLALRKLYYKCRFKFYEMDQVVFERGETCKNIYFVISEFSLVVPVNGCPRKILRY